LAVVSDLVYVVWVAVDRIFLRTNRRPAKFSLTCFSRNYGLIMHYIARALDNGTDVKIYLSISVLDVDVTGK
jgi:hypothetical protein